MTYNECDMLTSRAQEAQARWIRSSIFCRFLRWHALGSSRKLPAPAKHGMQERLLKPWEHSLPFYTDTWVLHYELYAVLRDRETDETLSSAFWHSSVNYCCTKAFVCQRSVMWRLIGRLCCCTWYHMTSYVYQLKKYDVKADRQIIKFKRFRSISKQFLFLPVCQARTEKHGPQLWYNSSKLRPLNFCSVLCRTYENIYVVSQTKKRWLFTNGQ